MSTWTRVPLGEVTSKIGSGATPLGGSRAYKQSGIPLIRSLNVQTNGFNATDLAYIDEAQAAALIGAAVRVGDVLLNITGLGTLGRVTQAPQEMDGARVNQHVSIIRPIECLDSAFLSQFLASPEQQELMTAEASGVTRQAITKAKILEIQVPIPPLNEQRRIVAKIEELTARSRRAREALEAIPALLDRFRQSVLAAAFRGDLTADWRAKNPDVEPASVMLERVLYQQRGKRAEQQGARRKEPHVARNDEPKPTDASILPGLPDGWSWSTLDQLLESLRNGIATKPGESAGLPILRISAVRPLSVNLDDVRYLPVSSEYLDYQLRENDLLFTRYNGNPDLVGVCGMVRHLGASTVYPDKLIRGRMIPGLSVPAFIEMAVNTGISRMSISSKTKSAAGQVGISGSDLRLTPIPLPPLAEQLAIVEIVERLFQQERAARMAAQKAAARLDFLDQSILFKAFRGELVPQDPKDEPASVLLERIRAEQAEAVVPKAKRGRKPRTLAEA